MTNKRRGVSSYTPEQNAEITERILSAAVATTQTHGYRGATRDAIARKAGVSAGLVNRYFGTMSALMQAVLQRAVDERILSIVVQGLAYKHPVALAAPPDVRAAAVASVGGDL